MLDKDLVLNEKDDCDRLHNGEIDHREFNQRNLHRYAIQAERHAKKRVPWWRRWLKGR